MRISILILLTCVLASAQATDGRVWRVRFGTDGDTPLTVSSSGGVIEFRNEKGIAFTIPAASITSIFHTRQEVRRSTQVFNFFEDHCCGGTDSHLLSALAFLIAAPLGSATTEYVEVDWTSKGPGKVQLRLEPEDYMPFMDWLSRESGIPWRDLEKERREAIQQIAQHASEAFSVTELGSDAIEFDVLPVEANGNTYLYFFRGGVSPKNLVWIQPVTEEPSHNTCVNDHIGGIVRGPCRGERCELRAVLRRQITYRPGTLPRTYTVDVDGLAVSECATAKVQRSPTDDSVRPTLKRVP